MRTTVFAVDCPSCVTTFPIDPLKVPEVGVNAQCTVCEEVFLVERPTQSDDDDIVSGGVDLGVSESVIADSSALAEERDEAAEEPSSNPPSSNETLSDSAPSPFDGLPNVRPAAVLHEDVADDADAASNLEAPEAGTPGGIDADRTAKAVETFEDLPAGAFENDDGEIAGASSEEIDAAANVFVEDFATQRDVTAESVDGAEESASDPADRAPEAGEALSTHASEEPMAVEAPAAESATKANPFEETSIDPAPASATTAEVAAPTAPDVEPSASPFGRRSPEEKAARLARVLISDMITYNPDKYSRALESGSLKEEFEDEVEKSWKEYVDQVGAEIANGSSYFQDALNDIFAKGEEIF